MKIPGKYWIIILVTGWFLGAASGLLIMRYTHPKRTTVQRFEHLRQRFVKELKLTPMQANELDTILSASRQKVDQISANTRTQMEDVRNSTRKQVRQLLTPEQQGLFDALDAKMQARHLEKLQNEDQGI
jgi:Spy/CpxP family protein refolding chaperone